MLSSPKNYSVLPTVYPVGKEVSVTVVPNERAFLFLEDEEYTVTVFGVNDDVPDRTVQAHHVHLSVKAKGGVLRFQYIFTEEQEYTVMVSQDDTNLCTLPVFALEDDLYTLTPLRGDLHAHSYRSDGKRDPVAFLGHFREQGYDFTTLSDHNRYYPGAEIDEAYQDVRLGITHIQGEEVHVPGTPVHIVHVGGRSSVAQMYIDNSPEYRAEMKSECESVPESIPAKYADRYAMAKWSCDKIHAAGGLAIFAHPYWKPRDSKSFNVCDELTKILLESGMFDAYELIGGMSPSYNNRSVNMWAELRSEGVKISVVGSSDVHGMEKAETFPHNFTVCFARSNCEEDIINAVRKGLSLAVEAQGYEYQRVYRCYGSLRLATYGRFLLENYFPTLQRVCQGEGVAMRAYAMGRADKQTVECQVELTERFKAEYFGRVAPTLPSQRILDFEGRARARHYEGPITKGSIIYSDVITRHR